MVSRNATARTIFICALILSSQSFGIPDFCKTGLRLLGLVKKEKAVDSVDLAKVRSPLEVDMEKLREMRGEKDAQAKKEKMDDYLRTIPETKWDKYGVGLGVGLVGVLAAKAGLGYFESPESLKWLPGILPAAWYMADVGSQFLHKWLDSFASDRNPLWGPMVRAFRVHHEFPKNLTKDSFNGTVAPTAYGLSVPMIASAALISDPGTAAFASLFYLGAMLSVESHKQAHKVEPNIIWRTLQKMGLTLTPKKHAIHHKPPFDESFGTLNGWADPLFRSMDFWRKSDKLYWSIFKEFPSNWLTDPRSIPPEVVTEITEDLDKLPPELWAVGETLPQRMPASLKDASQKKAMKRRDTLISGRQDFFRLLIANGADREEIKKEWESEQKNPEFKWLYRGEVTPLDAEGR